MSVLLHPFFCKSSRTHRDRHVPTPTSSTRRASELRAASDVEARFARARFHASYDLILPQPVQSSRHQIVHQVIAGRNAAKDVAHPARLFLAAHLLVTEGYLFRSVVHGFALSQGLFGRQTRHKAFRVMPALPEVETTVRGLRPVLEGQLLARVGPRRSDLRRPIPPDLRQRKSTRLNSSH